MRNESVKTMTMCAIMAALMCILGPMSIPIGAVPISFTNLVIYLTVYLLGAKKGCISYLIYMLLGVVGLPVLTPSMAFNSFTSRYVRSLGVFLNFSFFSNS